VSDASRGSYLSPEPLLQNPNWVESELQSGHQVPAYAYARNNPVRYVDPDGLQVAIPFPIPWPALPSALPYAAFLATVGPLGAVGAAHINGVGAFHDPPAGIPYPPVVPPALPHPASEPGVSDLPAPVCTDASGESKRQRRKRCWKEKNDFYEMCVKFSCNPADFECTRICADDSELAYQECLKGGG
jgi:hypothetical protein